MKLSAASEFVLKTIKESGGEAYVVGGAVRNYFLGLPAGDYDVTCSFPPEKVRDIFLEKGCRVIETGIRHGTVTVRIFKESVEITSFRSDGKYSDSRHPESVEFVRTIEKDLERRDFTVNAMCFDGVNFVDLFGGREDCEKKIIRAIGDPYLRFREDALRILRALRFASALGFEIEENTKAALFAQKRLILNLSAERVTKELKGILLGDNAKKILFDYREILAVVLPELALCFDFDQRNPYHAYDVYTHSVLTCVSTKKDFILRFAALTHDVGKPETFFVGSDAAGHFYGHEKRGAIMCECVADRLKLSSAEKKRFVSAVAFHGYPIVPGEAKIIDEGCDKYILRSLNKLGEQTVRDVLSLQLAEALSETKETATRRERLTRIAARLDLILSEKMAFTVKDLKVDGNDLKSLGYDGREIGEALNALLSAVMSDKVRNEKAELIDYLKDRDSILHH
ncbi:MAG: HD domain-containing protein [Candidatus Borkfalkiaceae bacterium]|nr:HD domain-containing protein [Christensenellaceae bacterium]